MSTTSSKLTTHQQTYLERIRFLSTLMDSSFNVFGFRFGFDSVIGVFPVLGDFLGAVISLYIVWLAHLIDVPKPLLEKMVNNIAIDAAIGSIPLAGDIFDVFFKANKRNVAIIERYFREGAPAGDYEETNEHV